MAREHQTACSLGPAHLTIGAGENVTRNIENPSGSSAQALRRSEELKNFSHAAATAASGRGKEHEVRAGAGSHGAERPAASVAGGADAEYRDCSCSDAAREPEWSASKRNLARHLSTDA
jgi:hypothetical protein